ncbi:SDR family NAD(P)-dependent oxidoreductase [Marinobacter sp. F4216]|uniref:SDR family NAD(P)-dependent oxidoreductase n=1 Tax=Marinobacter sp. F4216 TaxID=2874281 RepID=UPI001CC15E1C|nr:SDR family oxidoreductase [Marinobacter sp. F4216]MBZ2167599.1 SDR family oxidoreductase [Marinobacter sp. F4216]
MGARRILVTGASRGLGRAITEHLLAKGDVVYGCSRGQSDLSHENYHHFSVDIGSDESIKTFFFELRRATRSLDALINNAGIASMNAFALTPPATYQQVFNINVQGTYLCSQKALGMLRKSDHGRIINFTTVAVPLQLEGESIYAASKSAVETLTKVIAKEYGNFGITCNAIGPSPIDTSLIKGVPASKIQELVQRQAIKKMATPGDVINVIDFYLQPGSDFITGQVLYLGGVS